LKHSQFFLENTFHHLIALFDTLSGNVSLASGFDYFFNGINDLDGLFGNNEREKIQINEQLMNSSKSDL
jgi:hypothetical protein